MKSLVDPRAVWTLRMLFAQQIWEVHSKLTESFFNSDEFHISLGHWNSPLSGSMRPHFINLWYSGHRKVLRSLLEKRVRSLRYHRPSYSEPEILIQQFSSYVNESTIKIVNKEATKARSKVKKGASYLEARHYLIGLLHKSLSNPSRSINLLRTIGSKLYHNGMLSCAKSYNIKEKKWISEEGGCAKCRLINNQVKPLDESFGVNDLGISIITPPFHALCNCSLSFLLE